MRCRVAIAGAGPAGCAAALTLRRYLPELSVVLISTPPRSTYSVGETVSPGILPLLRYLGLDGEFLRAGHLPCGGTASAWGSAQVFERNYVFTGGGTGWHLDRAQFDDWLLCCAVTAGAHAVPRALAGRAERRDRCWHIEIEGGETIIADAVIDATGRTAWLARQHAAPPAKDDALLAEARWFLHGRAESTAAGALIEAVEDGWWYSATLPGGRAVAMFLTDADLRSRAEWNDRLSAAPATEARIGDWSATGAVSMRPAHSQRSHQVAGDCWAAAGDAALAFDPISALGIGFSLRSGMEAARVVTGMLEGDGAAAQFYAASIARIWADYRMRLISVYSREGRWPESSFWARRHRAGA